MLWREVGVLGERLDATLRTLEETNRKLKASEDQLTALSSTVSQLRAGNQGDRPQVAFSAAKPMEKGNIGGLNVLHHLVYHHVVSNTGNAYSPVTGYFTAPVKGVYYFSFTSFFCEGDGKSGGGLYQNGNQVVSWYGYSTIHPTSNSNSAVLQLKVGDKVNVRIWAHMHIGDNVNHYSTFGGFLLFPV